MTDFEKWYKKEHKRESNPNVYYGAELGWKAALKWALDLRCENIYTKMLKESDAKT